MLKSYAIISILGIFIGLGSSVNLKRIRNAIEKGDYTKAEELVNKYEGNFPNHAGLLYYKSVLHYTKEFSLYNLDSARTKIQQALSEYDKANIDILEDLEKDNLKLTTFIALRDSIRKDQLDLIYASININKIDSFMNHYPENPYSKQLEKSRDSLRYYKYHRESNTTALKQFLEERPLSVYAVDAYESLDSLEYLKLENSTNINRLENYLQNNRNTKYRNKIENKLLDLMLLEGCTKGVSMFVKLKVSNKIKTKAKNILYHYDAKIFEERNLIPNDSLKKVMQMDKYYFMALESGKFKLVASNSGKAYTLKSYPEIYGIEKCSLSSGDVFMVKGNQGKDLVNLYGSKLQSGVKEYKDLGKGVLFIKSIKGTKLYHKSGFELLSGGFRNSYILSGGWLAVSYKEGYKLATLSGKLLTDAFYDSLYIHKDLLYMKKNSRYGIVKLRDIKSKQWESKVLFDYTEIEQLDGSMLLVYSESSEGLLGSDLQELIPIGTHRIFTTGKYYYVNQDGIVDLYGISDGKYLDGGLKKVFSNEKWLSKKRGDRKWELKHEVDSSLHYDNLDSISLISNHYAVYLKKSMSKLLFGNGKQQPILSSSIIEELGEYILLREKRKVMVYDKNGELILSGDYGKVSQLNDSLFIVSKGRKYGLMDKQGMFKLKPVYELISEAKGMVYGLKQSKISCYDILKDKKLKGEYSAKPQRISDYYLVKESGLYGLVGKQDEQILPYKYNEIRYWDNGRFLVNENGKYHVFNDLGAEVMSDLDGIEELYSTENERYYRYSQYGKYGLMSTSRGELLKAEFTDIFYFGGKSGIPFFFAEQNLQYAGYHVVSYVNEAGEMIYSNAYRKGDFDRISCDD